MSFVTVYVPDCHESSTVSYGIIVTLCQKFVNPISARKRRKTAGFPTAFPLCYATLCCIRFFKNK